MDHLSEVIAASDHLAGLIESAAPRGLKHARHFRTIAPARKAVERVIRSYFRRQEQHVLNVVKPRLPVHVREATQAGLNVSHSILSLSMFQGAPDSAENYAFIEAISDAILGASATLAKELALGKIAAPDIAGMYLQANSLTKLTGGLSQTSLNALRNAIADAWDAGGSFNQIIAAIQQTFDTFSTVRAGMIAATEVADAYNFGRFQIASQNGMSEKAWETESGDPCEICLDNEAEGYISIDSNFASGDDAPTAHPRCLCTLNFRK